MLLSFCSMISTYFYFLKWLGKSLTRLLFHKQLYSLTFSFALLGIKLELISKCNFISFSPPKIFRIEDKIEVLVTVVPLFTWSDKCSTCCLHLIIDILTHLRRACTLKVAQTLCLSNIATSNKVCLDCLRFILLKLCYWKINIFLVSVALNFLYLIKYY